MPAANRKKANTRSYDVNPLRLRPISAFYSCFSAYNSKPRVERMKSYLLNCVICIMDPTSLLPFFLRLLRCWRTLKVRPWRNKHTWAFTARQISPSSLKVVHENQSAKEMMESFRWCGWQTQTADFIVGLIGRLEVSKSACDVKISVVEKRSLVLLKRWQ